MELGSSFARRRMALLCQAALMAVLSPPARGLHLRMGYTSARDDGQYEAAIGVALDKYVRDHGRADVHFSVEYRSPGCNPLEGMQSIVQLIEDDHVDVIFGQRCSSGYYITYRNLPFYPSECTDPQLDDKSIFRTLVHMMPTSTMIGTAVGRIFRQFSWTKAVLFTAEIPECDTGASSIRTAFKVNGLKISEWMKPSGDETDAEIREYLALMRTRARIMIICHSHDFIYRLIGQAHDMGMTGPDYVYLSFRFMPTESTRHPWIPTGGPVDKAYDAEELRAFSSLKQLTGAGLSIDKLEQFRSECQEKLHEPPWNLNYTRPIQTYSMFLADAAWLWLMLVNETITEGGDYRNGTLLFQKAAGKKFKGWTGDVHIDSQGDRVPHYWMSDCNPDAGQCTSFASIKTKGDGVEMTVLREPYWGTADGLPPPDTPACGFNNEHCIVDDDEGLLRMLLGVGGVLVVMVLGLSLAGIIYWRRRGKRDELERRNKWKVNYADISFPDTNITQSDLGSSWKQFLVVAPYPGGDGSSECASRSQNRHPRVANYKGAPVSVEMFGKPGNIVLNRSQVQEFIHLKELSHENINPFIGACFDGPNILILTGLCAKGTLQAVLRHDDIKLDWVFKNSFISDLVNSMVYLHDSPIHQHGRLTSLACLIDNRWVLKVTDYGLEWLKDAAVEDTEVTDDVTSDMWCAPEVLRESPEVKATRGGQKADVYSFGIILQEIVFRAPPYFAVLPPAEIVKRVRTPEGPPFRPPLGGSDMEGVPADLVGLMDLCWAEDPSARPSFDTIRGDINKGKKTSIMDNLMLMMEKYANNLEELVNQRTMQLYEEQQKTDKLLYTMLPESVAEMLKKGQHVRAELFDDVTIYFSDIVGFTTLASTLTPMEVVDLLNDLYTTFDQTIEQFDVYKVETIGDAYMVASGLPHRNGHNHVREIANMALDMLAEIKHLRIQHKPDAAIGLRVGLHTGPCAAGVVGKTMPRYCLFGDSVNLASRMESTGEAFKIHISESTWKALDRFGLYTTEPRGLTEIKGKGKLPTYWLIDRCRGPVHNEAPAITTVDTHL